MPLSKSAPRTSPGSRGITDNNRRPGQPMQTARPHNRGGSALKAAIYVADSPDLLAAFAAASPRAPSFYRRDRSGDELLALGVAHAAGFGLADGPDTLSGARERIADATSHLDAAERDELRLIGWSAFDPDYPRRPQPAGLELPGWDSVARRRLFIPEVCVRRSNGRARAVVASSTSSAAATWDRWRPIVTQPRRDNAAPIGAARTHWLDRDRFRDGVRRVTDQADAPKVVLARRALLQADADISPTQMLRALSARYSNCACFALAPGSSTYPVFVGATPERLARVTDGELRTMALAGTTRGEGIDRADAERDLLRSSKDRDEHRFVVDMMRRALAPLCDVLRIDEEPRLHRLANVSHLLTEVRGTLGAGAGLAGVVDALHPTPAVCGAPRDRARRLIRQLEGYDRGLYAGALGWMDLSGDGDFDVCLRCALIDHNNVLAYAGAGITADSNVEAELLETHGKFAPISGAVEELLR